MPIYLNAIDIIEDPGRGQNPFRMTRKELDAQQLQTPKQRQLEVQRENERIKNMLTQWAREDMERYPYEEDD